jgi:hypothetical protein
MISPLLTDLYQLTMAHGYFRADRTRDEAVFHLFFRKLPFSGGYAVAAGLEPVLDFIRDFRFAADDVAYLASLAGDDGVPLFGLTSSITWARCGSGWISTLCSRARSSSRTSPRWTGLADRPDG